MKKKVISLVLVLLLVFTMVIPASAASQYTYGTYADCDYGTFNNCTTSSWSCLIEYLNGNSSYQFKTNVRSFKWTYAYVNGVRQEIELAEEYIPGTSSGMISGNSKSGLSYTLSRVEASYYVNGEYVTMVTTRAS